MSTLTVRIEVDNAAFDEDPHLEVARILRELAIRYEREGRERNVTLYDVNGNRVGLATWPYN
jgi:hypothetical protein